MHNGVRGKHDQDPVRDTDSTTLFQDAVDVPIWLEADARLPRAERAQRDRDIGRSLSARDDVARVRGWWRNVERTASDFPSTPLEHGRRWIGLALIVIGLAGGAGFALAAYRYDGTYPVNVVRVLALLLGPQLVLLVLNLLLLPGRVPGLRRLQDALAAINPGALAASVYRQLARRPESRIFAWASARSSAARRFAKWQMLYWSQVAAVGFNISAIVTAIVVVTFTDLAFGWSTTLDVDAGQATRIVAAIGAPWQPLLPGAVPDAALVERSLFFRLEGASEFTDSRALTGWWSFTVLAVAVYGLVPRLAFLGLAGWRLGRATQGLLLADPRVTALLDRMSAPVVETRGAKPGTPAAAPAPAAKATGHPPLAGTANAVIWNEAVTPGAAAELTRARLGLELDAVAEAGGGALAADRAALERVTRESRPVVVLTPAWEPPLLEFADFVGALREAAGPRASIIVVPIGEDAGPVGEVDRESWAHAVARIADPRVYVEPGDA